MSPLLKVSITTALLLSASLASAQGYEYVEPGEYTFGHCGVSGGDSVPTTYRNQRYFDQFTCNRAYYDGDKCYLVVKQMEIELQRSNQLAQCSSWLRTEYNNCRRTVAKLGQWCAQLSR